MKRHPALSVAAGPTLKHIPRNRDGYSPSYAAPFMHPITKPKQPFYGDQNIMKPSCRSAYGGEGCHVTDDRTARNSQSPLDLLIAAVGLWCPPIACHSPAASLGHQRVPASLRLLAAATPCPSQSIPRTPRRARRGPLCWTSGTSFLFPFSVTPPNTSLLNRPTETAFALVRFARHYRFFQPFIVSISTA